MKKSFTFRASWARIISQFSSELRREIYGAAAFYHFEGCLPPGLSPEANVAMTFITADIEKSRRAAERAAAKRAQTATPDSAPEETPGTPARAARPTESYNPIRRAHNFSAAPATIVRNNSYLCRTNEIMKVP